MTEQGKKVLAGFVSLSSMDRHEVVQEMNRFQEAPEYERRDLKERFMKQAGVIMGPVASGCPCCGR